MVLASDSRNGAGQAHHGSAALKVSLAALSSHTCSSGLSPASPGCSTRWHQVTMMTRPPGAHTRASSFTNLLRGGAQVRCCGTVRGGFVGMHYAASFVCIHVFFFTGSHFDTLNAAGSAAEQVRHTSSRPSAAKRSVAQCLSQQHATDQNKTNTHVLSGMCSPLSRDHTRSKLPSPKGCCSASATCNN